MFLTDADIIELTGYRQPRKQCEMLRRQGIPFHTNAAGHPKVARAILEGGRQQEPAKQKAWRPSWADAPA